VLIVILEKKKRVEEREREFKVKGSKSMAGNARKWRTSHNCVSRNTILFDKQPCLFICLLFDFSFINIIMLGKKYKLVDKNKILFNPQFYRSK
jgi:hypothetical protein